MKNEEEEEEEEEEGDGGGNGREAVKEEEEEKEEEEKKEEEEERRQREREICVYLYILSCISQDDPLKRPTSKYIWKLNQPPGLDSMSTLFHNYNYIHVYNYHIIASVLSIVCVALIEPSWLTGR